MREGEREGGGRGRRTSTRVKSERKVNQIDGVWREKEKKESKRRKRDISKRELMTILKSEEGGAYVLTFTWWE